MVSSLWSALPLEEQAKYERKAEQNLQHAQNVQKAQNMQNHGREVEEEGRVSQDGRKLEEERALDRFEESGQSQSSPNWQINNVAEQEKAKREREDNICKETSASASLPPTPSTSATVLNSISSPEEENSLDLIGDSQPYGIFYKELRQVIGC